MLAELSFPHASYPVQDVRMFTYLVYFSAYCVPITHVRQRQEVQRLNASVNSSCAQPPLATAGHLSDLSVPGVGHLQILHCPGAGHLPTAGPFPNFWHVHSFLSEYNYTEGFTGKKSRLAHLSRTGIIEGGCKGMFSILCMHFFIAYQTRIYT